MADETAQKLSINVQPGKLAGQYANGARVATADTGTEFVLDFLAVLPEWVELISRMVMAPEAAKGLYTALGMRIQDYESKFGVIRVPQAEPQVVYEVKQKVEN